MLEPLPDPLYQYQFIEVQLRSQPDLPDHILGQIQWLSFSEYPGYYLWNPENQTNRPVEFLEDYWYYIYRYEGDSYISHTDCIEHYSHNTGYWRITDPEHPEHVPEELPLVAGPSTLTVPRRYAETLESVELSPFQTAPNPELNHSDPEDEYYEPQTSTTEQATDVLAAQFQHILDLEDRVPENPLTPQVPAYLHLVEEAVEAGLNVPPPPPLAEPEPELQGIVLPEQPEVQVAPIQVPIVFTQPIQPVPQPIMAQQGQLPQQAAQQQAPAQQPAAQPTQVAAPTTDKLRGIPPEIFKGDRRHSELFLHQFNLYWGLNETHEIMQVLYFHMIYALSLMRGPNIDDWAND